MIFGHDEGKNIVQLCDGENDVISVGKGGTGGTTAAAARKNLGLGLAALTLATTQTITTAAQKILFTNNVITSDKLSYSGNGVKIGSGVSKVKVISSLHLRSTASGTAHVITGQVKVNDTQYKFSFPCYMQSTGAGGTMTFEQIVDVAEGDIITLWAATTVANKGEVYKDSQLIVEIVQ